MFERFENPNDAVKAMRQLASEMNDGPTEAMVDNFLGMWEWLDGYLSAAGNLPAQWSAERSVMLCIRDPDESNQFVGDGEPVAIYDCDLGRMDLTDDEERAGWIESQEAMADDMDKRGAKLCAETLSTVIAIVEERKGS